MECIFRESYTVIRPCDETVFVEIRIEGFGWDGDWYFFNVFISGFYDEPLLIKGDTLFESLRNSVIFINKFFHDITRDGGRVFFEGNEVSERFEVNFPILKSNS